MLICAIDTRFVIFDMLIIPDGVNGVWSLRNAIATDVQKRAPILAALSMHVMCGHAAQPEIVHKHLFNLAWLQPSLVIVKNVYYIWWWSGSEQSVVQTPRMYKQAVKETFCLSHDPSIKHNPSHQSPPLINPLTIEAMSDSRERSDRVWNQANSIRYDSRYQFRYRLILFSLDFFTHHNR